MKISILVVAYNHEKYISDAIDSILMQSNSFETEIIVLDDASTDKTHDIASLKLEGTRNVLCVKNPINLGITKNYKKGFSLCTGDYIFVLEGDDYWLDTLKVQRQVDFLERYPFHSMCFHPFHIQKGDSRRFMPYADLEDVVVNLVNPANKSRSADFHTFSINDLIKAEGLFGTFSVCCFRRKWIDKLPDGLFEVLSYDWAVNLFMGHFGLIGRLNSVMSVYRHSENAEWMNKTDAERSAVVSSQIPDYDRLLNYEYTDLFNEKLKELNFSHVPVQRSFIHRVHRLMPPFIPKIIKLIIPPAVIKK